MCVPLELNRVQKLDMPALALYFVSCSSCIDFRPLQFDPLQYSERLPPPIFSDSLSAQGQFHQQVEQTVEVPVPMQQEGREWLIKVRS